MRILVFEYISGGGMLAEPLPASLAREGDLMLGTLLRDLAELPGVHTVALRDARLGVPAGPATSTEWIPLSRQDDVELRLRECIEQADAVWPIAPETGGILERLCLAVEALGKPLLSSPAAGVRLAASKLATVRRLRAHGVVAVPTQPYDPALEPVLPAVAKPDDGVGCVGTRVLETPEDWSAFARGNPAPNTVVQPLAEGEALSLSALFANGETRLLGCNRQQVVREGGGFVLKACGVNAIPDESGVFRDLVERIALAIPELWGYVGVDLIRSQRGLCVLEINPRLTTSYVGLQASTGLNPAKLVLETWRLGRLPEIVPYPTKAVEIFLEPQHVH